MGSGAVASLLTGHIVIVADLSGVVHHEKVVVLDLVEVVGHNNRRES